jgi:membrane protein YdbS with pleckstrin-like domain
MWLSEPIYESLPYYYMALGIVAGVGSYRVHTWYWSEVLAIVAAVSLVAGLVLWLKRRDYRRSRSRLDVEADDQA